MFMLTNSHKVKLAVWHEAFEIAELYESVGDHFYKPKKL